MAIAEIGPVTSVLETAATAVGAGVILGSTALGILGLRPRGVIRDIETRAVAGGYLGGAVGGLAAVIDAMLRYGFSK